MSKNNGNSKDHQNEKQPKNYSIAEVEIILEEVSEIINSNPPTKLNLDDMDQKLIQPNGISMTRITEQKINNHNLQEEIRPIKLIKKKNKALTDLYKWKRDAELNLDKLTKLLKVQKTNQSVNIPSNFQRDIKEKTRALIGIMSKNNNKIAKLEAAKGRYHVVANISKEAIELRSSLATEAIESQLNPDPMHHLNLAYATYMLEGNSPKLRENLTKALRAIPNSNGLSYWLARYQTMVGNYEEAYKAVQYAPNYHKNKNIILPLIDVTKTNAPWLKYPSNFYHYRKALIDNDKIEKFIEILSNDNREVSEIALTAMNALYQWNEANNAFNLGKYSTASKYFLQSRASIVTYFSKRYSGYNEANTNDGQYGVLIKIAEDLIKYENREIWRFFRDRYQTLTLEELHNHDWVRPKIAPNDFKLYDNPEMLINTLNKLEEKVKEKLESVLLLMGLVLIPFGLAEANRMLKNFDEALHLLRQLTNLHQKTKILSQVIEVPFIKILVGQILLEKGDSEYKARLIAKNPIKDEDGRLMYQGLLAAETYLGVLSHYKDQGEYINKINTGLEELKNKISFFVNGRTIHPYTLKSSKNINLPPILTNEERSQFKELGQEITIESIEFAKKILSRNLEPHESLTKLNKSNKIIVKETNPLIFNILMDAKAKLLQLEAGLNYLGYRDDFIPPWRFQFLLGRARYYAEHAKSGQSEFINFLSNAEREEFQEKSMSQNVALEKSNIRIESARVDQVRNEVEVAKQSKEMAHLIANNSEERLSNYQSFDNRADQLADQIMVGTAISAIGSVVSGISSVTGAIGGFVSGVGGLISQDAQNKLSAEQRQLELANLEMAVMEANASAQIADSQLTVAKNALIVAAMQRASAVFRHEFAVQNLDYMRNRMLSGEQWYRLANMIRGISQTYLNYAIELSFLAEQAYEFESDTQKNIIRFDYDANEIGSMLAADFLLADLDTLEQDMITTQKMKQLHVRYVVSLAQEFPSALQKLREKGETEFTISLESLERRFPGLFNLRIGTVDALPIALMDPTRFSLELTYMGLSKVRLRGGNSDTQSWNEEIDKSWPVKTQLTGVETQIFSGMSKAERDSIFTFMSTNQRNPFEQLGAASSWHVDMSMKENRVDTNSIADLLITFNISGYFDPSLKKAIEEARPAPRIYTKWISARQYFQDSFYEFNHSGSMNWPITSEFLSLNQERNQLRNIGILFLPNHKKAQFNNLTCQYNIDMKINETGELEITNEIPKFAFNINGLEIEAICDVSTGVKVTWNFGDEPVWIEGNTVTHQYLRPGKYTLVARIIKNNKLYEHKIDLTVSREHSIIAPVIVYPKLELDTSSNKVIGTVINPANDDVSVLWNMHGLSNVSTENQSEFEVVAEKIYTLTFIAIRKLSASFYSRQCYKPNDLIEINNLRLLSNREFDRAGNIINPANHNTFTTHVFSGDEPLTPEDEWSFQVTNNNNPFLTSVTANDQIEIDFSNISDLILTMEYETKD